MYLYHEQQGLDVSALDESLTLPLDTSGVLECCSSSDDEEYNSAFTQDDAVEEYKDWLDQQAKDIVKMHMKLVLEERGVRN